MDITCFPVGPAVLGFLLELRGHLAIACSKNHTLGFYLPMLVLVESRIKEYNKTIRI